MFLKLTSANGADVRVNFDLVESYGVITSKTYSGGDEFIGMTYVITSGMGKDDEPYIVQETPAWIDSMVGFGI